jgi:hypothetical protein
VLSASQQGLNTIRGTQEQGREQRCSRRSQGGNLKSAWVNAWPERVNDGTSLLHKFDAEVDESNKLDYRFDLQCYRVRWGLFSKKFVIFVRALFKGGSTPLGFVPARRLDLAIGRTNMVMSGDEVPYRSLRLAMADNEV